VQPERLKCFGNGIPRLRRMSILPADIYVRSMDTMRDLARLPCPFHQQRNLDLRLLSDSPIPTALPDPGNPFDLVDAVSCSQVPGIIAMFRLSECSTLVARLDEFRWH
jgi:hypothetical protein